MERRNVRESTKQGNDKVARQMESAHRTSLAKGEVGIRERKPVPSLSDFLKNDFVPFVKTKHTAKPGTAEYYVDGAKMVRKCDLASDLWTRSATSTRNTLRRSMPELSASRINCGLRSLRRALNLAFEWGKLERPVKITLAKGENGSGTRFLTDADWERYIAECPQPWRDAAISFVAQECALAKLSRCGGRISI